MLNTTPRPHLLVTMADLERWLAGAENSEALQYHRGFLAIDRITPGSRLPKCEAEELDRVATTVMAAVQAGRAHLLQRRHGAGDYTYRIVAKRRSAAVGGKARSMETVS